MPDDGSAGPGLYLKVYREAEAAATTLAVTDALARRNDQGDPDRFVIPETVAFDRELRALVLREERAERTLDEEIRSAPDPAPAARRVARALADLHRSAVPLPTERTLQADLASLEADARRLALALPSVGSEVRSRVGLVLRELAARAGPRAPTHGDLKGDHILLDPGRLVLLDWDFAATADPVLDAGYLLAHLMALPHRAAVRKENAERAVRAFAEEYRSLVPDAWGSRLAPSYVAGIVQVAGGFFRRQEPDWREKVLQLLREGRSERARFLTSRASTPP
jgi:aminoglycoside phosphotransferase (APT) family kinase protein